MLTGDKQETAVNIAYATRLLHAGMRTALCTSEAPGGVPAAVATLRSLAREFESPAVFGARGRGCDDDGSGGDDAAADESGSLPLALVLDERVLDAAARDSRATVDLRVACAAARAVICCRVRPDQKAAMVELVRLCTPVCGAPCDDA